VPDADLRWTLLAGKRRIIRTSGVSFNGLSYVAAELNGLVGEAVEVRYLPHDARSVEIFRNGEHVCTAKPQGTLTEEERAAVLARRRADAAEQARRQRRTARSARSRVAPITGTGPVEETTVISERSAASGRTGWDDAALRRAARADLLDLPSRRAT
jgi:putative transposase